MSKEIKIVEGIDNETLSAQLDNLQSDFDEFKIRCEKSWDARNKGMVAIIDAIEILIKKRIEDVSTQ